MLPTSYFDSGIRKTLIGYLLILSILPLATVGIVAYAVPGTILKKQTELYLSEILRNQRYYIELQLENAESLIANVSGVEEITEALSNRDSLTDSYTNLATTARVGYILNGYLNLEGLVSIDLFSELGHHYHVGDTLDVENIRIETKNTLIRESNKSPFQVHWSGVVPNVNSASSDQFVVSAVSPLRQFDVEQQNFVPYAHIMVNLGLSPFYEHFSSINIGEGGYLVLIDEAGKVIYHPQRDLLGGSIDQGFQASLIEDHAFWRTEIDGVQTMVSSISIPQTGWKLVSLVPTSTLTAGSDTIAFVTAVALAILFALISLVALRFSKEFIEPLRQVINRFRAIQERPSDTRLSTTDATPLPHGRGEIGELVTLFNSFLVQLQEAEKADRALLKSQERFRNLAENTSDWIWEMDTKGIYTYSNPKVLDVIGLNNVQIIGKSVFDLKDAAEAERFEAEFMDLAAADRPTLRLEHAVRSAGGQEVFLEDSSVPVYNDQGKLAGYRGISRDISERTAANRHMAKLVDELQRSNEELEQFAYVASHDLQEPLRMVTNFLQLLQRKHGANLDPQANEYIGFAVDGAKRMRALIMDLLSYSRVTSQEEPFGLVNLNEVVDRVKGDLVEVLKQANGRIEADPLPTLLADKRQMVSLFQNLIGNAIKYRSDDRPLVIRITTEMDGSNHTFSVTDNGIGIDPAFWDKIFTIFQRLHQRSEYEGTGIGLAVCKKIILRHGGWIKVYSTVGKGSTFHFMLQGEKS